MILRLYKVSGCSLDPLARNGDYVLVSMIPIFLRGYRVGDLVVFRDDVYGVLIKFVQDVDTAAQSLRVSGTADESVDSRQLGWVNSHQVAGVVVARVRAPNSSSRSRTNGRT